MTLIEWTPEFSLGEEELDDEHRDLIQIANRLYEQIQSGRYQTTVIDSLETLHTSAAAHFAHEEEMMRTRNYAAYEEHRADHRRLLAEVTAMIHQCQDGVDDDEALAKWLYEWFCNHFKTHDAPLHQQIGA